MDPAIITIINICTPYDDIFKSDIWGEEQNSKFNNLLSLRTLPYVEMNGKKVIPVDLEYITSHRKRVFYRVIKSLIDEFPEVITSYTCDTTISVFEFIVRRNYMKLVKWMMKRGKRDGINLVTDYLEDRGKWSLMYAIEKVKKELILFLRDNGADMQCVEEYGVSVLENDVIWDEPSYSSDHNPDEDDEVLNISDYEEDISDTKGVFIEE